MVGNVKKGARFSILELNHRFCIWAEIDGKSTIHVLTLFSLPSVKLLNTNRPLLTTSAFQIFKLIYFVVPTNLETLKLGNNDILE